MVFVALIAVASVNLISTKNKGVLGAHNEGDLPLAQFAVPNARTGAGGDANIAQDDCDAARIPCPSGNIRAPACRVEVPGAIRDKYFVADRKDHSATEGRPVVL